MTAKTRFDILGIGTLSVDDFLYVESYPAADHKTEVQARARRLGGQIGTGLAAASSLGATCACAGILGHDELSRAMREGLAEAGIDLRYLQCGDAAPIHSVVVVERTAKTRTIFYDLAGAKPLSVSEATPQLAGAGRVLMIDQLGPETGIAMAECARALDIPVVLDMEWPNARMVRELLSAASHVLVSLDFGSALTGSRDPERIAGALHSEGRECTAVTCGVGGCYAMVSGGAEVVHIPAFAVETVETTGCGDVFHGAYATALSRGQGVVDALWFASAAAAVYASRPAGWRHLPRLVEVEQMLLKLVY